MHLSGFTVGPDRSHKKASTDNNFIALQNPQRQTSRRRRRRRYVTTKTNFNFKFRPRRCGNVGRPTIRHLFSALSRFPVPGSGKRGPGRKAIGEAPTTDNGVKPRPNWTLTLAYVNTQSADTTWSHILFSALVIDLSPTDYWISCHDGDNGLCRNTTRRWCLGRRGRHTARALHPGEGTAC